MPYTIRPPRAPDLEVVRRLLEAAKLPLDGLEDQFGERYVVAESPQGLIGVEGIELYGHYGLLRSAVVDPAWRGKRVGEALTRERLAWARTQGLRAIYLLTTTAADYFPRFGFQVVDRSEVPREIRGSREFSSACPESAVVMRLGIAD